MIITNQDLQALGYCNKGSRSFAAKHGLDWCEFVKNGLPEEIFTQTGDAMAIRLVEFTKERNHG